MILDCLNVQVGVYMVSEWGPWSVTGAWEEVTYQEKHLKPSLKGRQPGLYKDADSQVFRRIAKNSSFPFLSVSRSTNRG